MVGILTLLAVGGGALADDADVRLRKQVEQLQQRSKGPKPRPSRAERVEPNDPLGDLKNSIAQQGIAAPDVGKAEPEDDGHTGDGSGGEWDGATTLRGHYRLSSGIGFPAVEEVVMPPMPTFAVPTPIEEPAVWRSEEPPLKRPPRCEKNGTNRVLRYSDLDDTKILHERIYLSEDMVPLDAAEVYGSQARLVPYGEPTSEEVMRLMQSDQVPCVPFRRRLTKAAIYEDWGINALKNYEAKPSAAGVFHPWVEQKLFGGK